MRDFTTASRPLSFGNRSPNWREIEAAVLSERRSQSICVVVIEAKRVAYPQAEIDQRPPAPNPFPYPEAYPYKKSSVRHQTSLIQD
jgi:hypothetical protein